MREYGWTLRDVNEMTDEQFNLLVSVLCEQRRRESAMYERAARSENGKKPFDPYSLLLSSGRMPSLYPGQKETH